MTKINRSRDGSAKKYPNKKVRDNPIIGKQAKVLNSINPTVTINYCILISKDGCEKGRVTSRSWTKML